MYRILFCLAFFTPIIASAQITTARADPEFIHQAAVQSPLPMYPTTSIRDMHHGVAVVQVLISSSGTTSDIKVLQSPDAAIADSVAIALKSWRFKPFTAEGRATIKLQTRFIFYFDLDKSGPHVTDALRSTF